ncbi:MAG: RnfABCDGE type electron transport complex subunit D, partial [Thermoanaerobaculia bacterium]|nr:RnfABCDGE type electron transport complex subunit D [Thermoanaerobaculia bacterium]
MSAEPVRIPLPPPLHVAPGPHLTVSGFTAQRMMADVLIGLLPVLAVAIWVFRWYAVFQVAICVASALAAEALFSRLRGRKAPLGDLSAAVTGLILGLSLPWSAPWHVGVIGSFAAIGLGKAAFGGLGQNLFNPAMVGRAFVMIAFAASLAGGAYVRA